MQKHLRDLAIRRKIKRWKIGMKLKVEKFAWIKVLVLPPGYSWQFGARKNEGERLRLSFRKFSFKVLLYDWNERRSFQKPEGRRLRCIVVSSSSLVFRGMKRREEVCSYFILHTVHLSWHETGGRRNNIQVQERWRENMRNSESFFPLSHGNLHRLEQEKVLYQMHAILKSHNIEQTDDTTSHSLGTTRKQNKHGKCIQS